MTEQRNHKNTQTENSKNNGKLVSFVKNKKKIRLGK